MVTLNLQPSDRAFAAQDSCMEFIDECGKYLKELEKEVSIKIIRFADLPS